MSCTKVLVHQIENFLNERTAEYIIYTMVSNYKQLEYKTQRFFLEHLKK
jgi:hypothetical protein